jgi:hypothetical protein
VDAAKCPVAEPVLEGAAHGFPKLEFVVPDETLVEHPKLAKAGFNGKPERKEKKEQEKNERRFSIIMMARQRREPLASERTEIAESQDTHRLV